MLFDPLRQKKLVVCFIIARLIMSEPNLILSKEEQRDVFKIISEIKACVKELAGRSRPMFDGNRFLSDSELARRLGVSKSTLANYRLKGIFGYYSLEGKILYADTEIEDYLKENYHPPYR